MFIRISYIIWCNINFYFFEWFIQKNIFLIIISVWKIFLFCSFKAPAAAAPVSTEAAPAKEEKKKEEPEEESDDDMGFGNLSNLHQFYII